MEPIRYSLYYIFLGDKGDAAILQPSTMCAVPTVVERIYKGIHSKINAKGPFMVQLFDFCVQYRTKWVQCGFDTPIMNKVIFSKFRSLLGGRMKMLLSGGAPLAEESQNFVRTVLCTTLHQGNGIWGHSTTT